MEYVSQQSPAPNSYSPNLEKIQNRSPVPNLNRDRTKRTPFKTYPSSPKPEELDLSPTSHPGKDFQWKNDSSKNISKNSFSFQKAKVKRFIDIAAEQSKNKPGTGKYETVLSFLKLSRG